MEEVMREDYGSGEIPQGDPRIDTFQMAKEMDPRVLEIQLDVESILESFRNDLSGYKKIWDPNLKNYHMYKVNRSIANQEGIDQLVSFLRSLTNKNIIFSNFDTEDIRDMVIAFSQRLNDQLFVNGDEWEINVEDRERIILIAENLAKATLNRAIGGEEKNLTIVGLKTTENINPSQHHRAGFLERLSGGRMKF